VVREKRPRVLLEALHVLGVREARQPAGRGQEVQACADVHERRELLPVLDEDLGGAVRQVVALERGVEWGQVSHADGGAKSLIARAGVGSSGRIRTEEDPPTPDDSDLRDPEQEPT
jgi:hypothetical protein